MKYGIFGGAVNGGTVDDVVAEARSAEADGFASYWAPNIFGHDALTCLAIVGREVPRIELGTSVVPTYPRHPHAGPVLGNGGCSRWRIGRVEDFKHLGHLGTVFFRQESEGKQDRLHGF